MNPIVGKTYSLAVNSDTSDEYFGIIKELVAAFLKKLDIDEIQLLRLSPLKKGSNHEFHELTRIDFIEFNIAPNW